MSQSNADTMRAFRARQKALGNVNVSVWVPKSCKSLVVEYAKTLQDLPREDQVPATDPLDDPLADD